MLTPSSVYPCALLPCSDLRQRIATACFEVMSKSLSESLAQPKPSRVELEDPIVLRAVEVLSDQLLIFGRPDLATEIENRYYAALSRE